VRCRDGLVSEDKHLVALKTYKLYISSWSSSFVLPGALLSAVISYVHPVSRDPHANFLNQFVFVTEYFIHVKLHL